MKTFTLLTIGVLFGIQTQGQTSGVASTPASTAQYQVVERGANHKVWNKITESTDAEGRIVLTTNQAFVELATGQNYWEDGQWKESRAEFEITPQGYAVARYGQHKVVISSVLNDVNGVVDLRTPSGRRMRSTILGLALHDRLTGTNVLVATIKGGTVGRKATANEIIFSDCFDTINADVRFAFQCGAFHQDVILREAIDPLWVKQQGCNPQTTRLEIWTEFFESPSPRLDSRVLSGIADPAIRASVAEPDTVNDDLDFGDMKMPLGRAYAQRAAGGEEGAVQVPKRWLHIGGRTFLVESMSLLDLKPLFAGLPDWRPSADGKDRPVYAGLRPPAPQLVLAGTNSILTASLDRPVDEPGVVLDYQIVNSGGSYTFKSDTTYYVSSQVWLSGNVIFEGGTVIKYAPGANWIYVAGSVDCQTGPYRPAVFTSKNDNSVGEIISGSTGSPAIDSQNYYLRLYYLSSTSLHHLRMAYASYALNANGGNTELTDAQFVHNGTPIYANATTTFKARNILMDDVSAVAFYGAGSSVSVEHLTLRSGAKLGQNEYGSNLALTNSLLVSVANMGTIPLATNFVTILSSSSNVFQTVGAGNSYLATNSPYRDAGTTNINTALLASLKLKTTYAPVLYSNVTFTTNLLLSPQVARDTNAPDLGYHYEPVDYLVALCSVTNAALTVTNGTVVASYLDSAGLWLKEGSSITAIGTPNNPVQFTYYNTVQEQPKFLSSQARSNFVYACLLNPYHAAPTLPSAASGTFQFTKFTGLAGAGVPFCHQSPTWDFSSLSVRDSEFGAVYGLLTLWPATNTTASFNNNLFQRTAIKVTPEAGALCTFSNNLFWGSNTVTLRPTNSGSLYAFNNAFDASVINLGVTNLTGILSNNFNAYLKCTGSVPLANSGSNNVIRTNSLSYQTGSLGGFYQPTNSPLINVGSVANAGLVGFYYYTTTTNQIWETNSPVDIGYHYVSVDIATGLPIDSDWDGIPNYADPDSDNDGIPDWYEIATGLNPSDSSDAGLDPDGDGFTNLQTYQARLNGNLSLISLITFTPSNY